MIVKSLNTQDQKNFNNVINHPLQSMEWKSFRENSGISVIQKGFFDKDKLVDGLTLTLHKIPHTPWKIGYFPKGKIPDIKMLEALKEIGKEENCIFIQLEPNVINTDNSKQKIKKLYLKPSFHPLFTKYTFLLDLTKSEEELLKNMHSKTRYNIKVAQKHKVEIIEDNSDESFKEYLKLTEETTKRQGFFAHTPNYHKKMWETLKTGNSNKLDKNQLTAHLFLAKYTPENKKDKSVTLAAWILFVFKDTLYYPYGSSSNLYRNVMASNLMMWEAIKFGKKLGLKQFDMWGALSPNPNPKDPWHGFHKFKEGYGAILTEFIGSYDLVINPILYQFYKVGDKLRWLLLKIRR